LQEANDHSQEENNSLQAENTELRQANSELSLSQLALQQELADARAQLVWHQNIQTYCNLVECPPGDIVSLSASSQLRSGWAKKEAYELGDIVSAYRIENPYLEGRYNTYKNTLIAAGALNGGETLAGFPWLSGDCAMDPANPDIIIRKGFLKRILKTSAGDWQRFGPGVDQPCTVL
jgi:DNA-binding Xre family transcriptional regulator